MDALRLMRELQLTTIRTWLPFVLGGSPFSPSMTPHSRGTQVVPPPTFADKRADFVQTVRTPLPFAARYKFHRAPVRTIHARLTNVQTEPFQPQLRWLNQRRSGRHVPAGEQVVAQVYDKSAVPRPHQRFGGGRQSRQRAAVISATAIGVGGGQPARTGLRHPRSPHRPGCGAVRACRFRPCAHAG